MTRFLDHDPVKLIAELAAKCSSLCNLQTHDAAATPTFCPLIRIFWINRIFFDAWKTAVFRVQLSERYRGQQVNTVAQ